ncbi:MAG: ribosome silencing factor [Fimbriimonadales bacterium]
MSVVYMFSLETLEKVEAIKELAESIKAESIEVIDVSSKTVVTNYIIVCSGTSDVHVRSIADRVNDEMRKNKMRPRSVEGRDSGWVLLDFGDVVFHVMREEQRQFYDLESLWKMMPASDSVEA